MKTEVRFRRAGAVFELVYHALRARLADQGAEAAPDLALVEVAGVAVTITAETPGVATAVAWPAVTTPSAIKAPTTTTVDGAPERALRLVADAVAAPRESQPPLGLGFGRGADGNAAIVSATGITEGRAAAPAYAGLRVLGQIFAGFVALEGEDGLILIDQHAAHERVTFEKLRAELHAGGIRVQPMLTPATIELNPARAAQVTAALPELRAIGFELEPFGPATILLKGAPAVFGAEGGAKLLTEMIDSIGDNGLRRRGEGAFDELLKTLACHGSVRAGRTLEMREIAELLAELDRTEFKTNCPHGRPVHIEFRRGQIERMFRR
jgi:DNA mismatch repair protein MutL